MQKVKAIISYDGTKFQGFQRQKHTQNTVAGEIEKVLKSLIIDTKIVGSGRTDRGVHALNQVISFKIPIFWDLEKLKQILNQKLKSIYIKNILKVKENFNARFSAKSRSYIYIFKTKKPSIFEENYISHHNNFSPTLLKEVLKIFKGEHNFLLLSKKGSNPSSTIRTIYISKYKKYKNYHIIYFKANGFLRSQVRLLTKTSILYAQNKISKEDILNQLTLKEQKVKNLAPPNGLYLSKIYY